MRRTTWLLRICPPAIAALLGATTAPAASRQQKPDVVAQCRLDFAFTPSPKTTKLDVTVVLPPTLEGRQKITKLEFSPEPSRRFEEGGTAYAVFSMPTRAATFAPSITMQVELRKPENNPVREPHAKKDKDAFRPWLAPEKFLEVEDKEIVKAARALKVRNDDEFAKEAAKLVTSKLQYTGFAIDAKGAAAALQSGGGDCTEFADLMVSLCRARGIPARQCCGFLTRWDGSACHNWVEVYGKSKGWSLFDPEQARLEAKLLTGPEARYITFSTVRNDTHLDGYQIVYYRYEGEPVKFVQTYSVTIDGKTSVWSPK